MKKDNIAVIGIEGDEKAIDEHIGFWENNPYYNDIIKLVLSKSDSMPILLTKIQSAHEECSLVHIIHPEIIAGDDLILLTLLYSLPHASEKSDHKIVCIK